MAPRPYRNPKIEQEMLEDEMQTKEKIIDEKLKEPAKTEEDENWKLRYGDLRRGSQEALAAKAQEIEDLRKQLESVKTGKVRPPKSESELNEWIQEYPDFADILKVFVRKEISEQTKDIKEQSVKIKKREAFLKLKEYHADFEKIVNAAEFHEWLKQQSDVEQSAIYAPFETEKNLDKRVKNASFVIDKWKAKNGSKKGADGGADDTCDVIDSARAVKIKTKSTFSDENDSQYEFSESQIQKMNEKDFEKNFEKIHDAQRRGKILMDITGGAR